MTVLAEDIETLEEVEAGITDPQSGIEQMLVLSRATAEEEAGPLTQELYLPQSFRTRLEVLDARRRSAFNHAAIKLHLPGDLVLLKLLGRKKATFEGESVLGDDAAERFVLNALINWQGHQHVTDSGAIRQGIRPLDISQNSEFLPRQNKKVKANRLRNVMDGHLDRGLAVRLYTKRATTYALAPNVIVDFSRVDGGRWVDHGHLRIVGDDERADTSQTRLPISRTKKQLLLEHFEQTHHRRAEQRSQWRKDIKSELPQAELNEQEHAQLKLLLAGQLDAGYYATDEKLIAALRFALNQIAIYGYDAADIPQLDVEQLPSRKIFRLELENAQHAPEKTEGWESRLRVLSAFEHKLWVDGFDVLAAADATIEA